MVPRLNLKKAATSIENTSTSSSLLTESNKPSLIIQHTSEPVNIGVKESYLLLFLCVVNNYVYFILSKITNTTIKETLIENCKHIRFDVTHSAPALHDLKPYL